MIPYLGPRALPRLSVGSWSDVGVDLILSRDGRIHLRIASRFSVVSAVNSPAAKADQKPRLG